MTTNDAILLDTTLSQMKQSVHANLDVATYFEVFCAEQILKNYDLSYEELTDGIVGGGGDGGIDNFYTFIDGELLDEDTDLSKYKKPPAIDVFVVQAKQSDSFSETAIDKLSDTLGNIFNLSLTLEELKKLYNGPLVTKSESTRNALLGLAARHPEFRVYVHLATKGDVQSIHPKVSHKAQLLTEKLRTIIPGSNSDFTFWGARELLDATRRQKTYTLQLRLIENPIATGGGGYVALANLKDYWEFVSDNRSLRKYVFESNVRDWQGDVEVNQEISATLSKNSDSLDFWWLNNGITILCSRASLAGKIMSMDDVQVVNGLQTTVTMHEHFKTGSPKEEKRSVLIRIVETTSAEARDRIIKATNHQTAIPPASLKATDRVQRDIETYFKEQGWYYDRRKNYYKNLGMPVDRIIGIPYLAQAIMAILLAEPDNARARPTTLIKNENDYKRVFSDTIDLELYLFCARLMKVIEERLRVAPTDIVHEVKRNLRFHIATLYVAYSIGTTNYKPRDVYKIIDKPVPIDLVDDVAQFSIGTLFEFMGPSESLDQVVKSKDFSKYLLEAAANVIGRKESPDAQTDG